MSDASAFGFGKFIPGFDFLKNIGKAGTPPAGLPPFSHWVAPTVSVEEIEKRIEELKAVQFWLEQNGKALAATVQALEVQKMTLSTLKGMNVNLAEMAKAFPFAAVAASAAPGAASGNLSDWPMSAAAAPQAPAAAAASAPAAEPPAAASQPASEAAAGAPESQSDAAQSASMATAMQWWGALTQQFQQIAQQALQDPAQQQAILKATQMSTDFAKTAVKTAGDMVRQAVTQTQAAAKAAAPQRAAAKTATKTSTTARSAAAPQAPVAKKAAPAKKASAPAAPKKQAAAATKTTAKKPR